MNIDGLCVPGHKGLLGIQGCGAAILREGLIPDTLVEGGSGYASLDPEMPSALPERGEAGTLPTPAIAGLCAGLEYLERVSLDEIREHERSLFCRLRDRLDALDGYHVYLPEFEGSTLMFHRQGVKSEDVGRYLSQRGICVRTGYHCCALGHATLHTPNGGSVRVSFGPFNRAIEVDQLYRALREMP